MSSPSELSGTNVPPVPTKPRAERQACVNCHQRKIRCDAQTAGIPCKNCRLFNRTDCCLREKRKRTRRSAITPTPFTRLPLHPISSSAPIPRHLSPIRDDPVGTERNRGDSQGSGSQCQVEVPSMTLGLSPDQNPDNLEVKRHLAEFFGQADLNDKPIGLGVRLCYVGTDVSNLHFLVRERERSKGVHHFPTLQLSRRFTAYEPGLIPQDAFVLPDKALVDELMKAYFEHVAPGFPIIDESVFMAQYNSRDPSDPPSLLVLHAILMVGAHVSKPQPERDTLKAMFFRRAKLLFDARHERDRLFVVQAALLMTWHSDGAEDIAANCWHYVGIAARTATGLGMHCDVKPSTLVPHDKRTWRRVWWILVQFDVLTSLSYGRPQAVNLEDCDVPPLTASDFEGCSNQAEVDYVIKYTELCVLISTVLRARFSARKDPERRKQVLRKADEALAQWFLLLPEHLRPRSSHMNLWPALLHVTYNNFLIVLHRPQPFSTTDASDYLPNDSDICGEAAGVIVTISEELRQTDQLKYSWISSVHALFTAMIQVNAELRFSNPVLTITGLRRFDSTLFSLRYLSEYWLSACTILRLFEEKSERMQNDPVGLGNGRIRRNQGDQQPALNILESTRENELDWRQLFSFSDTEHEPLHAPVEEDEWRELYWQEISMPDFGEVFPLNM